MTIGEGVEQPERPVLLVGMKTGTPASGHGPEVFTARERGRAGPWQLHLGTGSPATQPLVARRCT